MFPGACATFGSISMARRACAIDSFSFAVRYGPGGMLRTSISSAVLAATCDCVNQP